MPSSDTIRAEVSGRAEPVELPGDAEVGQNFVVDGVQHVVEEITLRLDQDRQAVVLREALMRPIAVVQPTRA